MKKLLTLILIILSVTTVLQPPTAAQRNSSKQKGVLAAELLDELADRLTTIARRYKNKGQTDEARVWLQWATLYRVGSQQLKNVKAQTFLRDNIKYCNTMSKMADRLGLSDLSELYDDSASLWADISEQLGSDVSELEVSFPRSMLRVIPGAPGTPWQNMAVRRTQNTRPVALCNRQEYDSCVRTARGMTSPTLGTMTTTGIIMLQQCRQWIAGCN